MKLIVDADACPKRVLQICQQLGRSEGVSVWTVASFNHSIISDHHVVVGNASQEADLKIINLAEAGDIVITQDWGLAAMVLGKQAKCISPLGREYRSDKIEFLLEEREIKAKLRRGGGRTKGPKKRVEADDHAFVQCLKRVFGKGGSKMALSLSVYFDFSCPYCYIAWGFMKKLKATVAIADEWVTWEIHPDVNPHGDLIQNVVAGVSPAERKQKLNQLGAPVGLAPGEHDFVPNTRLALQATEFAIENNKMHEWIDAVYDANFVAKQNIGELEVLLSIARRLGLDDNALNVKLEKNYYLPKLLQHDKECLKKNIEWVPTIFNGDEKVLEGAMTYSEFEKKLLSVI